jgi:hypothetical protein
LIEFHYFPQFFLCHNGKYLTKKLNFLKLKLSLKITSHEMESGNEELTFWKKILKKLNTKNLGKLLTGY